MSYDKDYWENGRGSNYGGENPAYTLENYLPQKQRIANKIISLIGIPKTAICFGAGRGFQMIPLKHMGVDAYGIDKSKYAVDTAPEDVKDKLFHGDVSDNAYMMGEFHINQFELVTCFDVLEHIPVPELYSAILHAIRLSSNFVMINMPLKNIDDDPDESSFSTDVTHVSIYSPSWWITQFLKIGRPFQLELRRVEIIHNKETYSMFAVFQKYVED